MIMSRDSLPTMQLDNKVKKLVILFVFDRMAIPLAEATVLDICASENEWMSYIDCKQFLLELIETNLLYRIPKSDLINITKDGMSCLSAFYKQIPLSLRDSIAAYVIDNRMRFKRMQSYFCDYSKNSDGTYTVLMRINNDIGTMFELKLVVSSPQSAKYLYKHWCDKASVTYQLIQDTLLD